MFDTGEFTNSAILAGVLVGEIDRAAINASVKRIENLRKEIADGFGSRPNLRK